VRLEQESARHLEFSVDACAESYLVLSDSDYPGWWAQVDGAATPIHRADFALRAVRLSAGPHRVRFEYSPRSFQGGLTLSLLTLSGLAATLLVARRRRGA
jgi:uncharacterized membrane protein YfhO